MKTQNPFTGRSSGSLANVTASSYLGQNILKSKPLEVRNPNTDKQVNVRVILAQAAKIAKAMMAVYGIAKRSARTGRNSQKTARTALLAAILASKTGVAPSVTLSGIGISLSGNGISPTGDLSASMVVSSRQVMASWSSSIPTGGASTDKASLVLVNLTKKTAWEAPGTASRSIGELETTAPSGFASTSDLVRGFICFESEDGLLYDSISSFAVSLSA